MMLRKKRPYLGTMRTRFAWRPVPLVVMEGGLIQIKAARYVWLAPVREMWTALGGWVAYDHRQDGDDTMEGEAA